MTLPLEQSMERAKPIEEMARALIAAEEQSQLRSAGPDDWKFYVPEARAAFNCLVSHGFITIEGLLAMKAEQEAGE